MKPYYEDNFVTLFCADSLEVMPSFEDCSFDLIVTDPPYTKRVHENAKSSKTELSKQSSIDFDCFDDDRLYKAFGEMGRIAKRWVISTLAYQQAFAFELNPPSNLDMKRIGVWVKENYTPQMLGDRPAQAWEAIAYLHKANQVSKWDGGGKHGNYVGQISKPNGHPTAKPTQLIKQFISMFSSANDLVLDPFAGSGTTLLVAREMGRKVIGIELEEKYCELIANRLSQGVFIFEDYDA